MAKSLADFRRVKADTPPIMIAYGTEGIGKTTFGSEWPDPVFIQCERGEPGGKTQPEFETVGNIDSFDDVLDSMGVLMTEQHGYKTVVVDSLDHLEPLIAAHVCAQNKWSSLEDPGYGKGYVAADAAWREFIDACVALKRRYGIAVVWLAHCVKERFNNPMTDPYDVYGLKLHKRAAALCSENADIIGFFDKHVSLKEKVEAFGKKSSRSVSNGARLIFLESRPAYHAKNRYSMPDSIEYRLGEGYAALAPYFPQPTGIVPVAQAA